MIIADMNWMQVEDYLKTDDRAVVPLGSTEQHAYLSLAVIEVADGRPRQVSLRGELSIYRTFLDETFGSVLDKIDQSMIPHDEIETAIAQELFVTGPGDIQVAKERSPSHSVVIVIDDPEYYVMPIEMLDRLSQGEHE